MISNKIIRTALALVLPAVCGILVSLLLNAFSPVQAGAYMMGIIFYLIIQFILTFTYSFKAGSENFTQLLLVCLVIKLLLSLIFIVVLSFVRKTEYFSLAIHVVTHFVIFTIFEIHYILYLIRLNPAPKGNQKPSKF